LRTFTWVDLVLSSHAPFQETMRLFQFSMWSHDVVGTSIGLATDLKLGQYLKVWVVFGNAGLRTRDAHGVAERFLPVPCF
jgi:hypothetical protein